ncbi:MAG TPA: helix-turn-helix transcriptional regulator [Bacteroidales bacterium]|nr:helix-turn-helix transcriptional regulator [Bacteroidales bacterium]
MNKSKHAEIRFIVEKTDTGLSAYSSDYPVFSTGKTLNALRNNCMEALTLYFEDKPQADLADSIRFELDLRQFFQYYRVLNSRLLASRTGINPSLLSQYVRGHKKPSARQLEKIVRGIQEIGKELSEIELFWRN